MLSVQIDEKELEKRFIEELKKRIENIEKRHVFWDMNELCRQTCLSESSVKQKFFYDPRFPKFKAGGGKWLMPADECERFLLEWASEQPKH